MTGYETPRLIRCRKVTDAPLLILAVGSLPLLMLELARSDLPRSDRRFLDIVNVVVLAAFAIDCVVELAVARPRSRFVRSETIGHAWRSLD